MTTTERDNQERLLNCLYALLADIELNYPEDVHAIIESVGIDPDSFGKRMEKLARQTLREQAGDEIEAARREYDKKKTARLGSRVSILERIEEIFRQYPGTKQRLGLAHRNLENVSDGDLQSLLDDLEYLISSDSANG